jgi:hypothetical protein
MPETGYLDIRNGGYCVAGTRIGLDVLAIIPEPCNARISERPLRRQFGSIRPIR